MSGEPPEMGDELSRQRQKRAVRLLELPVAGFDDVTLKDVVVSVVNEIEEKGGQLDVRRFLVDRGHRPQTIDVALAYLSLDDPTHPSVWSPDRRNLR